MTAKIQSPYDFEIQDGFQIVTYSHEHGLLCPATLGEISEDALFVFLVNEPTGQRIENNGFFTYLFYLDEESIDRAFAPQSYQLVYTDEPAGLTFRRWSQQVVQYLSACLLHPAVPAFDIFDIAGVLLEARQHRLHFTMLPFVDPFSPPLERKGYNRLLVVVFHTEFLHSVAVIDALDQFNALADWVRVGGAIHHGEERRVMLLGDRVCCDEVAISTKNPLIPPHLRAIY